MNGVASQGSDNVQVIGMADERGVVNTHRPFLTMFWNGTEVSLRIHGFVDTTDSFEVPRNWVSSC